MSKEEQQQHITSIGGQAVMEGVMMRGPVSYTHLTLPTN